MTDRAADSPVTPGTETRASRGSARPAATTSREGELWGFARRCVDEGYYLADTVPRNSGYENISAAIDALASDLVDEFHAGTELRDLLDAGDAEPDTPPGVAERHEAPTPNSGPTSSPPGVAEVEAQDAREAGRGDWVPDFDAAARAWLRTTAYWPPEWIRSDAHIDQLVDAIASAAVNGDEDSDQSPRGN